MQILPMNNMNPMGTYEDQPLKIQQGYEVYDEYNKAFFDLQGDMDFPDSKDNTTRAREVLAQIIWSISSLPNDYPEYDFLQQFLDDDCRNDEQSSIWIHGVSTLNYMDCIQIWENPEMYLPIKDRVSELKWMLKPGEDTPTIMNALGFPTGDIENEEYDATLANKRAVFLETFDNPEYNFKDSTSEEKEEFIIQASQLISDEEYTTSSAVSEALLSDDCPIKIQKQHNYPHQVTIVNNYYKSAEDVIYGTSIAQVMASKDKDALDEDIHNSSLDEDGQENDAYVTDSVKETFLLLEDKETARKFMKSAFRRKDEDSGLWSFDENKSDFETALPSMQSPGDNKLAIALYSKEDFVEYCKETDIGPEDEYLGGYKHWANDMYVQDWVEGNDDTLVYEQKVLDAYIEEMLKMDDYEGRAFKLAHEACELNFPEILTYAMTSSPKANPTPKNKKELVKSNPF